ncbi:hypothetical protein AGMMS50267_14870 [Spirochaetia bacterium]|nr:hypothetical protein AGMMS50267_14870 [Spirochaetia bacterium]
MKKHPALFLALTVLAVLVGSCNLFDKGPEVVFDVETFNREWALWEAQGIRNYQYIQVSSNEKYGGSLDTARVTVRENKDPVIELLDGWMKENVPPESWNTYPFSLTISGIYPWMERCFSNAIARGDNVTILIVYHPQYHYPQDLYYHISSTESDLDGDGGSITIHISEFMPLTD